MLDSPTFPLQLLSFAVLMLNILVIPTPKLAAQKVELSTLTGSVTDQMGAVIPGAAVLAVGMAGQKAVAITSEAGSAVMTLEPGNYELAAQAIGFAESRKKIDFPKTNLIAFTLIVGSGSCVNCVTSGPILETTQPVVTAMVEPTKNDQKAVRRH